MRRQLSASRSSGTERPPAPVYKSDTIVACATAPGRAAVAIVRLSGPDCSRIRDAIFRPSHKAKPEPWRLCHGLIVDPGCGQTVDEVLAVSMPGPHSYNGEDILEIQCHGSPVVVERIIACAQRLGARAAEPGEFTRRAVLNGKMDLLQAEGLADLISAGLAGGAAAAWAQLQGALSARLRAIRDDIVSILADVEANIDFSDDELPEENHGARSSVVSSVKRAVAELLNGFEAARRQREGFRTGFSGRPNVGKSSLINALLGSARMIVCDEPGTTRDTVEEAVDLGGFAFLLTDTAGIRSSGSRAEAAAVDRARSSAAAADINVVVLDAGTEPERTELELLAPLDRSAALIVVNKCDLPARMDNDARARLQASGLRLIETSALSADGCRPLVDALTELARGECAQRQPVAISRLRHRAALENCLSAMQRAGELIEQQDHAELASLELKVALQELASITEPLDNEEVLDIIFGEFCIGK